MTKYIPVLLALGLTCTGALATDAAQLQARIQKAQAVLDANEAKGLAFNARERPLDIARDKARHAIKLDKQKVESLTKKLKNSEMGGSVVAGLPGGMAATSAANAAITSDLDKATKALTKDQADLDAALAGLQAISDEAKIVHRQNMQARDEIQSLNDELAKLAAAKAK